MKRKEIVETIDTAGQLFDEIDEVRAKNKETGEEFCVLSNEEVKAIQTALVCVARLLEGDERVSPMGLVRRIYVTHAIAHLSNDEIEQLMAECAEEVAREAADAQEG